jgi:hypothetical protein
MRFTLIKNLAQDTLMKSILNGLLLFIGLYFISDIILKYSSFGLFTDTINITLFGDEEQFIDPLTSSLLLEYWHVEIFFTMMILLTLSTIFIRTNKDSSIYVHSVMIMALISLVSLPLAYFINKSFVNIYSVSNILWHLIAFVMILKALWKLNFAKNI